jgi:hypothetical protein
MTEKAARRKSSILCYLLSGSLMFFLGFSVSAAKGKRRLEIPKGFVGIVAYGSLISLQSFEGSLGHKYEGQVHEVHLRGYERVWTCVRPWNDPQTAAAGGPKIRAYLLRGDERVPILGAAELDLQPKKKGTINGLLYLITDEELLKLDKREWGYRRADVSDKIEEFRFGDGKVYVYEGLPRSPASPAADQGTYVLIKEFFDLVTGACDARGKGFREDFDRSTRPCSYPVVSFKDIVREKESISRSW